ncbi:MAG: SMC-Scp complex subunit ScpB [Rhodospirillales bacterium]|nr:SMC-Scp complex subunit ScpB [Rhodospirillales bacterium]
MSETAAPAEQGKPEEAWLRLAEAMLFASAVPVTPRALAQILPEAADAEAVLAALAARYAGRGVELVTVAGGVQFRTAPDLAPALRKVVQVPRRLPRVAMETLAVIAYHQPVTRPEIEEIRGASLSQATLDALLEAGLIAPRGRRETPGRPSLWGTTPAFLAQFGLEAISDLPRKADLLVEPPAPGTAAQAEAEQGEAAQGEAGQSEPAPGETMPADQGAADHAFGDAAPAVDTQPAAPEEPPTSRGAADGPQT